MFEKFIVNKEKDVIEATPVSQEKMTELTGQDLEEMKEIEILLQSPNTEAFDNALKKEGMRAKLRKAVMLGMTLLAPIIASANNSNESSASMGSDVSKEISYDAEATESDVKTINFEDAQKEINNIEPDIEGANETDPENPLEDGIEKFEKVFDAGFEMGKADLSPEQIAELKTEFIEFLDNLPQEVKERINNGEAKIIVEGSTSYHIIDPVVGTDSGSRGQVFENETLAKYRAEEGVQALQGNVLGNVEGIDSAVIETSTRLYTQEDADDLIEEGRRLRIVIEDVIERDPAAISLYENVIKNLPQGHIEFILNDASESNKGYAGELFDAAKKAGYIAEGEKVDFYVGTTHRDVVDAGEISYSKGADNLTRHEQNDQRNKFTNDEQMVNASAKVLSEQPFVLDKDRTPGESKIGVIVSDESISFSLNQLEELQKQEERKNLKLVYMLADRETRETSSLTLEQVKDILINKLRADENPGKKFSFDTNQKEIQGGSADYLLSK